MSKTNQNNDTNKKIWGKIFWNLLFTIAQYSNNIDNSLLSDLIDIIPNVLPCDECQKHTEQIYQRLKLYNSPGSNYDENIWQLYSEIQNAIGKNKITLNDYNNIVKSNQIIINIDDMIALLNILSKNKTRTKTNCKSCRGKLRKSDIHSFIDLLNKICDNIPHLNDFKNVSDLLYMMSYH